jgi:uncharacterized SAM-binding protein YcdF (DUF218 family)
MRFDIAGFLMNQRSTLFFLSLGSILLVVAAVAGFPVWFPKFWRAVLPLEIEMPRADALVVLGGESQARPVEAARLFHAGVAPLVLVIGTGDHETNRRALLKSGVPADCIVVESKSASTLENADFSKPILESMGVRRALLVTSSFHARRALATFQNRVPGIEFGVAISRIGWWDTPAGRSQEDRWAMIECFKIPAYWLVHGIPPWTRAN